MNKHAAIVVDSEKATRTIYHVEPTHEAWQKLLEENEAIELPPEDFDIAKAILGQVVHEVEKHFLKWFMKKYKEQGGQNQDLLQQWLAKTEGRRIYYKEWTF